MGFLFYGGFRWLELEAYFFYINPEGIFRNAFTFYFKSLSFYSPVRHPRQHIFT